MAEKVRSRRRALSDFLLSAGALCVLLSALVFFDPRLRTEINTRMNDTAAASREFAGYSARANHVAALVIQAIKDQYQEHTVLTLFVVCAVVLCLFMVRT